MTTKELTVAEIREIAARAEKATPGPWEYDEMTPLSGGHYFWGEVNTASDDHTVAEVDDSPVCRITPGLNVPKDAQYACDGNFIAHSRIDVPALCETALSAIRERDLERQMWINVIAEIIARPASIELIGNEPNAVRDALIPVAEIIRDRDEKQHVLDLAGSAMYVRDKARMDILQKNIALTAELDRLRAAIEAAPHAPGCSSQRPHHLPGFTHYETDGDDMCPAYHYGTDKCDCFKSAVKQ